MFLDFMLERFNENKQNQAIIWKEKTYTYEWLTEQINFASKYLNDNKIKSGSLAALKSDFNPFSIAFFLALIENGNIVVPISYAVKTEEEFYDIAQVESVIEIKKGKPNLITRKQIVNNEILLKLKKLQHPGLILFSSGSTGKSKAAVHDFVPLLNKFKVKRHTLRTMTFLLFDHI